jgi:hypothetical protein
MGKATGEGMSAATGVGIATGALGAVTGAISMFTESKNKKKIAKEIANQKEATLTNIADGMQVSTLGSDLQKQENASLASSQISALQDGGTRALIGGIRSVTDGTQDANARIAEGLDEQVANISNVRAQDEQRIQMTKDQRQANKLAALSSQYNAASQNQAQGMATIVQSAGMAGNALAAGAEAGPSANALARQKARANKKSK